jgi:hypothetical protein
MQHVVHNVQSEESETHPGLMFYFVYKIFKGGETIEHQIPCDLNAPISLVIAETAEGHNEVTIIVGPDDKRFWHVAEIISLKFGFQREIV